MRRPTCRILSFVFLVLICAIASSPAYAQQVGVSWTGGTGNWSVPANWNPMVVPNNGGGTTYSVAISTPSSAVTLDSGAITIDNLTLGATDNLKITETSVSSGSLSLVSGVSSTEGTLLLQQGSLTIDSGATLNTLGGFVGLEPFGAETNSGPTPVLTIDSGGTFNNSTRMNIDLGSLENSGTVINNAGTLISPGISASNVASSISNNAGGSFTNNGTISNINGDFTNAGLFTNASSGLIGLTPSADGNQVVNSGTFKNSGTLHIFISDDALASMVFSNSGTIDNTGEMELAFVCCAQSNSYSNSGTLNNSGVLNIDGLFDGSKPNDSFFINTGTINNSGTLNLFSQPDHGTFGPAFFTNSNTLNNTGTISNSAVNILNNTGLIMNAGTFNNAGTLNNTGTFANSGTLNISSTGLFTTSTNYTQTAGSTIVDGTLTATNGAVVNVQGGTLSGTGTINANVTMAGTMMPGDAPGTLTIAGNYEQMSGGIFDELMSPTSQSLLDVSGNVMLDSGAELQITLLNGFDPLGQTFDIMNFSGLTGEFANGSSFTDDGFLWDITYLQNQIDVTAVKGSVQTPEPSAFVLLAIGLAGLLCLRRRWSITSALLRGSILRTQ